MASDPSSECDHGSFHGACVVEGCFANLSEPKSQKSDWILTPTVSDDPASPITAMFDGDCVDSCDGVEVGDVIIFSEAHQSWVHPSCKDY